MIGDIFSSLLSYILNMLSTTFFKPIFDILDIINSDPELMAQMCFVDQLWGACKIVGISLLVTIFAWQCLKVWFSFSGIEADDPWHLLFRTLIFGFLLLNSKELMFWGVKIVNISIQSVGQANLDFNFWDTLLSGMTSPFSLDILLGLYFIYKCVGLFFRMVQRYAMCLLLIVASPLAFACAISDSTKGFFSGFIKLFVGNLTVQFLQIMCIKAVQMYMASDVGVLIKCIIGVGIIKVTLMLEDIVRDLSVSIGLGRDMGNCMHSVQSAMYMGSNAFNLVQKFRG